MNDYGFTDIMGPLLREHVKKSLFKDLANYLVDSDRVEYSNCIFDWSDTCVEGHRTAYLDGEVENFSGISMRDQSNNLIADGWMEFIEENENLHVFWWYINGGPEYKVRSKKKNEIPQHIWTTLKYETQITWNKFKPSYLP